MQIELKKINDVLINFKKILMNYEENTLNLFNQLDNLNLYWKDSVSVSFFENVFELEQDVKIFLYLLNQYYCVFKYICNQYSYLGDFVLYKKSNINKIYNDILKIKRMLGNNNDIFCFKLEEFKSSFIKECSRIDAIERNVGNEFNKISIHEIKSDLFAYQFKSLNVDKNVMDVNEVKNIVDKIFSFRKEINYLSDEISLLLENGSDIYISSNSKKIKFFNDFFSSELKKICNYYNICETMVLNQYSNYLNASKEGIQILDAHC